MIAIMRLDKKIKHKYETVRLVKVWLVEADAMAAL